MIKSESCHFIVAGFFLSCFSVKKNWKKALKKCFYMENFIIFVLCLN